MHAQRSAPTGQIHHFKNASRHWKKSSASITGGDRRPKTRNERVSHISTQKTKSVNTVDHASCVDSWKQTVHLPSPPFRVASEKWSAFTFTARPATDARQRKSDEPVSTFPAMECRSDSVPASPSHEPTTLWTASTLHIRLWDLRHSKGFCASAWASQLPPVRSCAFLCD